MGAGCTRQPPTAADMDWGMDIAAAVEVMRMDHTVADKVYTDTRRGTGCRGASWQAAVTIVGHSPDKDTCDSVELAMYAHFLAEEAAELWFRAKKYAQKSQVGDPSGEVPLATLLTRLLGSMPSERKASGCVSYRRCLRRRSHSRFPLIPRRH